MHKIDAWLADKEGFYAGEIHAPASTDDLETFASNAAKNGQTAIDMNASGAVRPPDRPLTAAQQAMVDAAAELAALRKSAWSALTLAQQKRATDLAFQLGQTVPGITATA